MITSIEIENLRCFGERQRIELAPITLLYGPNNSGKSTAMYAMLLFKQWLDYDDCQIGPLELTCNAVDMGPSNTATHNHKDGHPICIKIEYFDLDIRVLRSMEIGVTPQGNDLKSKAIFRYTGDQVKLHHTRYESDGKTIGNKYRSTQNEIREQVKSELESHRIIGALREIPPPLFSAKIPLETERSLWFRGLAAWHWIGHAGEDNLIWTNQWLGPEYLDTGIEFVQQLMIRSDQLMDAFNSKLPKGSDISWSTIQEIFFEVHSDCERRVRLRPRQGKEIGSKDNPLLWPHEVGIGVTQILPIVVACMTRNGSFFMIQEPETHVHPRLQSRIGDLLIDSTADHLRYGVANQLMVESHSEHIIHRLKRRIRETTNGNAPENLELWANRVAINYFNQEDGATKTQQIHLDINGEFVEPWPDDFFDLDFNERFA